MKIIKIILRELAFLALSGVFALVATNIYYSVYAECSGSSAGVAFWLTFLVAPISAISIFVVGLASKSVAARSGYGQGIQAIFRLVWLALGSMLVAAYLLSTLHVC